MSMTAITILVGLGVAAIGALFQLRTAKLRRICTQQTDGEVIDVVKNVNERTERDENGHITTTKSTSFYPVYSYVADGRTVTRKSSTGTSQYRFSKGDRVTVYYNPDKIEQYYVAEDKASSRFGLLFIGLGVVVIIIGLFV